MVWAFVASLALLLAVATILVLGFSVRGRRQFQRLPGVFRCRLRLVHGTSAVLRHQWLTRPVLAAWGHDVLLVRLGRWPAAVRPLLVRFPEGSVVSVPARGLKALGPHPVMVRLRLDDGDLVEVAAPESARELLVGPFFVASISGDNAKDHRPPGA